MDGLEMKQLAVNERRTMVTREVDRAGKAESRSDLFCLYSKPEELTDPMGCGVKTKR